VQLFELERCHWPPIRLLPSRDGSAGGHCGPTLLTILEIAELHASMHIRSRQSIILTLAAAVYSLAGAASAQAELPSSIQEVEVVPRFADGALQGCAVNFQVLHRDTMYAAGEPVLLDGSLQVYNFGSGQISAVLKLGLLDIAGGLHIAPSQTYLVNGFATSIGEQNGRMPSDTPGFGLFSFRIGDQVTASIVSIMDTGKFSLAYQREGGSGGVPIEIDMSQAPEQISTWVECIDALLLSDR